MSAQLWGLAILGSLAVLAALFVLGWLKQRRLERASSEAGAARQRAADAARTAEREGAKLRGAKSSAELQDAVDDVVDRP